MKHAEITDCIHQLLFNVNGFFAFSGVILIVGAFRRWKWLVDPPLGWAPFYSQAAIKEKMGTTFLLYFTYFLGFVFLAFGGTGVYRTALLFHQLSTPPPHWDRPSS